MKSSQVWVLVICAIALAYVVWRASDWPVYGATVTDGRIGGAASTETGTSEAPGVAKGTVCVDSVPVGADVILLGEEGEAGDKWLGKTPLVIKEADCRGRRLWVRVVMSSYLRVVEAAVPEMKEWVESFRANDADGRSYQPHTFLFDSTHARSTTDSGKRLLATGPVYELGEKDSDRFCAQFVPRNADVAWFYSLMPAPGTAPHPDKMESHARSILGAMKAPKESIESAVSCLRRCGAATVVYRDGKPNAALLTKKLFLTTQQAGVLRVHGYDMTGTFEHVEFAVVDFSQETGQLTFDEDSSGRGARSAPRGQPKVESIYVDSVPSGAQVFAETEGVRKALGVTPLVVKADQCQGQAFAVSMEMEVLLARFEAVGGPELKSWVQEYRKREELAKLIGERSWSDPLFEFQRTEAQAVETRDANGWLCAVGPVKKIKFPEENRICVVFLPIGLQLKTLFPFMSQPGTFPLDVDNYVGRCRKEYGMDEDLAQQVVESLVRSGAAFATVRDARDPGMEYGYIFTAQGPEVGLVVSEHFKRRIQKR